MSQYPEHIHIHIPTRTPLRVVRGRTGGVTFHGDRLLFHPVVVMRRDARLLLLLL